MLRFQCPKCGGMYVSDGRCMNCGYVVSEPKDKSAQESTGSQQPTESQSTTDQPRNNLMRCPDCGKVISKDAYMCPHCGCPFPGNFKGATQQPTPKGNSGLGLFGTIVAIVVAILIVWYIAAPYSTPVWVQHIGGTIKAFITGEEKYTIFDPSRIGR